MQKPDRSNYTALDFIQWRESGVLELTPKFQRRGVWTTPARSSFIDTLIQSYPVPPLYLRVTQSSDKRKTVREVVDGQQRMSAILDFIDGKYALSRSLDGDYAGKRFDSLKEEYQDAIREYSFNTEVLYGLSDSEVLEIFSRLNRYSVRLNNQELRNGKWFGRFKQLSYSLAHEHIEFWRNHRIFTENGIARMLEVELTSELLILGLAGLQDKKNSIDNFYEKYDENFSDRDQAQKRFRTLIDDMERSVGQYLGDLEFRRPPLFYTLYGALYHHRYGVPEFDIASPKRAITKSDQEDLQSAITKLSELIASARADETVPQKYSQFVNACLRQTDNIQPRRTRLQTLYAEAFA